MFIQAHKLKRDYIITYEYDVRVDDILYNKVFEYKVKDCRCFDDAYIQWSDFISKDKMTLRDWYCDVIPKTRQQMINDEVYELVLAELFDDEIVVNAWLDEEDDNWEINGEDLTSIEKMFISYEAQVKYNAQKGQ